MMKRQLGSSKTNYPVPPNWNRRVLMGLMLILAVSAGVALGIQFEKSKSKTPAAQNTVKNNNSKTRPAALAGSQELGSNNSLAQVYAKASGGERILAFIELLQKTPADHLGELIDEVSRSPDPTERDSFLKLAYAIWTASNPSAAFAHAKMAALRAGTYEPLPKVLQEWAGVDSQTAMNAAQSLENVANREHAIRDVLTSWTRIDPNSALMAALGLPKVQSDAALTVVFDQWSHMDPLAAWSAVNQISNVAIRRTTQDLVIRNLADSDPAKALEALRSLPIGQQSIQDYSEIFQRWGSRDPTSALAALQQLPAGAARSLALESIFGSWSELDPISALQAAQSLPPGSERDKSILKSAANLAIENPESAGAFIAQVPPGVLRNQLINTLSAKWSDQDPMATLTWLDKNILGTTHDDAVKTVLTKLSQNDPKAAIAYIMQEVTIPTQNTYIQSTVGEWAKQDPTAAMAWVDNNLTGASHDTAMASVLTPLIASDPAAAAPYVATMPNSKARTLAIPVLAASLATQDIQAALVWVQNLPADVTSTTTSNALATVLNTAIKIDPAMVASYISSHEEYTNADAIITNLVGTWSLTDNKASLVWVETLPPGDVRDSALNTAVTAMAKSDPATAWDYIQNLQTSDTTIRSNVLNAWIDQDPPAVAALIPSLPEGNLREATLRNTATEWLNQDPQAASRWMNTLPKGPERDSAVVQLVTLQATVDPSATFTWATTIDDNTTRYSAIIRAAQALSRVNSTAAITAVQSAPLTDQQRANVIRMITPVSK